MVRAYDVRGYRAVDVIADKTHFPSLSESVTRSDLSLIDPEWGIPGTGANRGTGVPTQKREGASVQEPEREGERERECVQEDRSRDPIPGGPPAPKREAREGEREEHETVMVHQ
ncbi:hypothetical protein KIPB_009947 [Kipferlia bialata]|uniref:Uncharacterized protein n=1 Tax=Kipferlia bialata TaxID=797122 RepID=A0A391NW74_9EUKA|nr:hypothetical protein KIPB_009947 [Kipferlia bialata]|eukprot:g9947.t1